MESAAMQQTEVFPQTTFGCYLANRLIYAAAPVLAGVKPAVLVSLRRCGQHRWTKAAAGFCGATGLRVRELYTTPNARHVLVYDPYALSATLRDENACEILYHYSYPAITELATCLAHLKARCQGCGKGNPFPHEIGIFLGYPPADVSAFIRFSGKEYLCCNHWKVYHDEHGAREIFQRIEEAKQHARTLLSKQIPAFLAVEMLKNYFCTGG